MARTESKVEQVHPALENQTIKLRESFGWSLVGSQEVNLDKGFAQGNSGAVYHRSSKHIKLTFSRDLNLPNLNEIKDLERKYEQERQISEPSFFPGVPLGDDEFENPIVGIIKFSINVFALIYFPFYIFLVYPNKKKEYEESMERRDKIRKEVASLL